MLHSKKAPGALGWKPDAVTVTVNDAGFVAVKGGGPSGADWVKLIVGVPEAAIAVPMSAPPVAIRTIPMTPSRTIVGFARPSPLPPIASWMRQADEKYRNLGSAVDHCARDVMRRHGTRYELLRMRPYDHSGWVFRKTEGHPSSDPISRSISGHEGLAVEMRAR